MQRLFAVLAIPCLSCGCGSKQSEKRTAPPDAEEITSEWEDYLARETSAKVVTSGGWTVEQTAQSAAEGRLDFNVNLMVTGGLPEFPDVVAYVEVVNFTQTDIHVPLNTLLKEVNFEIVHLETGTVRGPGISDGPELFGGDRKPEPDWWIVVKPGFPEKVALPIGDWNASVLASLGHVFDSGTFEFRHKRLPTLRRRFFLTAEGELIIHQFLNPTMDRARAIPQSSKGN